MTALPRAARCYIIAMWLAAAGLIIGTLARYPLAFEHLQLLLIWLPLYVMADYFEVELALMERHPQDLAERHDVLVAPAADGHRAGPVANAGARPR